ncbi:MAG: deaminase [Bacteroidales bacterium]
MYEKGTRPCSNGRGDTRPNPLVGAVIVSGGKVIGEGYHRRAGEPHAEVEALQSVSDRSKVRGADIYVTLEPCSHWERHPLC